VLCARVALLSGKKTIGFMAQVASVFLLALGGILSAAFSVQQAGLPIPNYIISLATGLLLVYSGNYSILESRCLLYSITLFGPMAVLASGFYSPVLSELIKTLKTTGSNNEEYRRLGKKKIRLGAVLTMIAMSIVFDNH
jgi:ABC-type xylose transport system permease subunit